MAKKGDYSSDVTDEEWSSCAPCLTLPREDADQRRHDMRSVFNALRWLVRSGAPWRKMPIDFPPWEAVYRQTQPWLDAGAFASTAHDLRCLLRVAGEREPEPSAAIPDARALRSVP